MDYALIYGIRITGTVTGGPNAGRSFAGHLNTFADVRDMGEMLAKLDTYRGIFAGTIDVFVEQWHDRKPATLAPGAEWVQMKTKRGGFVRTWPKSVTFEVK